VKKAEVWKTCETNIVVPTMPIDDMEIYRNLAFVDTLRLIVKASSENFSVENFVFHAPP
jgi:hypothetical protein